MDKRSILIVGASSGIGYETAKKLISLGHTVYNCSRSNCDLEGVININLDVTNHDSLNKGLSQVLPDVLIYCAGVSIAAPVEKTTEKDFHYLFEVNFFGFVKTVQHIIPAMRNKETGKIIIVSSLVSKFPVAFLPFYNASKGAVNLFVKSLDIELSPYNISVTAMLPGGTATDFTKKRIVYPPEFIAPYQERMLNAVTAQAKYEQNGLSPETVAESIVSVVKSKKPPLTKVVGIVNKVQTLAEKIAPETLTAKIYKKKYNQ